MKRINYLIVWAFVVGIVSGCGDFDELNKNPDSVSESTPALLATDLIKSMLVPPEMKPFVNPYMLSKQIAWGEGMSDFQYNLLGRSDFKAYHHLIGVQKLIEASENENPNAYFGLATFTKAYTIFYLSLEVGDVPYSDALQGEKGTIKPKYDTQKQVMIQVLDDLEKAYDSFGKGEDFAGDPFLNGKIEQWKKVVAAFQLKVLMHLSIKEGDTDLRVKERFASIASGPSLMASNEDNFQIVFSNNANQIYPMNTSINRFSAYAIVTSPYIDVMKKYEDYRLFYYAAPAKQKIAQGVAPESWDAYIGVNPALGYADVTDHYTNGRSCNLNPRYYELFECEPFMRLSYAEQNFILAEAAVRGWINQPADLYYKKGIEASMRFVADHTPDDKKYTNGRKITDEVIAAYLKNPEIQLDKGRENGLEMILTQRYLASFLQFGFDTYYDYRRTGYPELPINPATNQNVIKDQIPKRWMYPEKETSKNVDNLKEALDRQFDGIDEMNKLMWILIK